jgi:hypothetical protein
MSLENLVSIPESDLMMLVIAKRGMLLDYHHPFLQYNVVVRGGFSGCSEFGGSVAFVRPITAGSGKTLKVSNYYLTEV